jgi:hypothetical protein
VDEKISKEKYLLFMKNRRQKRLKSCRKRVLLREDRKFLLQLESNPFSSIDDRWIHKERRCLQDLVLNLLPYLAYRLRSDSYDLLRVILLYDHYWTVLNALRIIRGKSGYHKNRYLENIANRLYNQGDEGTIEMLDLLV